jgi:trehalose 2-sulfotransferase
MPEEARGYLLCSTPRTGSTWLCGLLESSGVAGHPASYFRKADEHRFADQWGLSGARDKPLWYGEFVTAAVAAGTTDNGVFAARVMWGTLDEILDRLGTVYSTLERHDLDLLERAFGGLRFVYLRRHDTVAQAVSWFRAEQTDVWHRTEDLDPPGPEHQPRYDFEALDQLVRTIHTNNAAWEHWFTTVGIPPHRVLYEDVESDPTGVTRGILGFLGLELPPGREIISRQVRLRDPLSAEWISRYRTQAEREAGLGGGTSFLGEIEAIRKHPASP